jgi:hypothetical protein
MWKIILCKAKGINYICGNERCRDGFNVLISKNAREKMLAKGIQKEI